MGEAKKEMDRNDSPSSKWKGFVVSVWFNVCLKCFWLKVWIFLSQDMAVKTSMLTSTRKKLEDLFACPRELLNQDNQNEWIRVQVMVDISTLANTDYEWPFCIHILWKRQKYKIYSYGFLKLHPFCSSRPLRRKFKFTVSFGLYKTAHHFWTKTTPQSRTQHEKKTTWAIAHMSSQKTS